MTLKPGKLEVYRDKCRHFTGMQHKICQAEVVYDTVVQKNPSYQAPCYDTGRGIIRTCPKQSLLSQEEHQKITEQMDAAVTVFLDKRRRGICPECNKAIEPSKIVGRCLYAACGHRLGQV